MDRLHIVPDNAQWKIVTRASNKVVEDKIPHLGTAYRRLMYHSKGRFIHKNGRSFFVPDEDSVIQPTMPPPVFKVGYDQQSAPQQMSTGSQTERLRMEARSKMKLSGGANGWVIESDGEVVFTCASFDEAQAMREILIGMIGVEPETEVGPCEVRSTPKAWQVVEAATGWVVAETKKFEQAKMLAEYNVVIPGSGGSIIHTDSPALHVQSPDFPAPGPIKLEYSDDEARDEKGKWTSGGGNVGDRVKVADGSGIDSGVKGHVISWDHPDAKEVKNGYPFVGGRTPEGMGWAAVKTDAGHVTTVPKDRLLTHTEEPAAPAPAAEKPATSGPRDLSTIAAEIQRDWSKQGTGVNYAAKPYLSAMHSLSSMKDKYGEDSAHSVVAYFLSNARSWKGDTAKRVKAELKSMLKSK